MNLIQENFPLLHLNTFHVAAAARYFAEPETNDDIRDMLQSDIIRNHPVLILGGGSNILFTKDFDGFVIRPQIKNIEIISQDSAFVKIRAGAGEIWDDLVNFCVDHEYGGIENLSMIPGTVGACPVQNIGAYGAEIKDYIDLVEGFYIQTGAAFQLKGRDCRFSYRDSIFKNELKGKVVITHVIFSLAINPETNTSYPDVKKEMEHYDVLSLKNIRKAVMDIRSRKLPDPLITGNAGSFFKNPVVNLEKAKALQILYPAIPFYPQPGNMAKISAAWLMDQCGWKGVISGNTGTHSVQPLIIINRGEATGKEILLFAGKIQESVCERFGIKIEMEVNVV